MLNKKCIRLVVAILGMSMLLTACDEQTPPSYNYKIDMESYENAINVKDESYLILVNKENPCGADHVPKSLSGLPVRLTLYGKDWSLESNAALAAEALVLELHARGYEDIVISSAYRDYAYQQMLFNNSLREEKADHPDWTEEQCRAEVLTELALPGQSEHQTGLCVDLISTKKAKPTLDETFADNPAYAWLVENAHNFGFILRYPKGKEGITGYSYEPWHYRFVGVEAATAIHEQGITLEEYLK